MPKNSAYFIVCLMMTLIADISVAALSFSPTRVIFDSQQREVTFFVANKAEQPVMIQAWIDDGSSDGNPDNSQAPFVVLPPIFRLAGDSVQGIRIIYTEQRLAEEQESLFWLNLYELPALPNQVKQSDARLIFAVKTQVKLFYRPRGLRLSNQQRLEKMAFKLIEDSNGFSLRITNNSALYLSLIKLVIAHRGDQQTLGVSMLAPFSSQQYPLFFKDYNSNQPVRVDFSFIDDDGNQLDRQQIIEMN